MAFQHTRFDADALPAVRVATAGCGPKPGAPGEPRSTRGRWRALVLLGVHVAIAARVWWWFTQERAMLSPLEPSEAGQTLTEGLVNAGFVLFALAIVSTLVLGRFFCGWTCHVVALQDGCAWLLGKLGLRPKPVRSRLLAFVPLLVAFWMFVLPSLLQALEGTLPTSVQLALSTDDFWERFPGPVMAALTFLAVGFAAVWVLGAKGFCTYGCPYGAVFAISDRFAKGRIRVDPDACDGCAHCTAVCSSNVEVHREVAQYEQVVDAGCMKCLDCVSACPKDALSFGFGASRASAVKAAAQPPKRHWDFTWPEEIAMALVFLASVGLCFRGLYGLVPDLLAVTIGVVVAIAIVVGWRLVRRRDLTVQHTRLKEDGRFTPRGAFFGAGVLVLVAFTLHSGLVRWHDRAAQADFAALRSGAGDADTIRSALGHLEWLRAHGLWTEPQLDAGRGRLLAQLERFAEAEAAFEAAVRRSGEDGPWFELLDTRLALGASEPAANERAGLALEGILSLQATLEGPPEVVRSLGGRAIELQRRSTGPDGPTSALALANVARVLALVGDAANLAAQRALLAERFPGDPALVRLELWLDDHALGAGAADGQPAASD